jgi:plasmid replication initiation protein
MISMIEPEDESFKLYKINVKHFANLSGLDSNALYNELREVALQIKSKPLVIQGHVEPGDPNPTELITSWFADVVIQANGDGYFGVSISERLKPYLLQVKREFFKYRLAYVLHLRRAMLFGSISGQSVGNIAVSAGSRLASFAL